MTNFSIRRPVFLAATALSVFTVVAGAQRAAPLPRKYVGPPTVAEITAGDLMTRVYKFADDSLMGRAVGTIYNDMGTAYIESEVRRLGLQPAGDNGTYFQKVPIYTRQLDSASTITVDGITYKAGVNFVTSPTDGFGRPLLSAQVVFVVPCIDMQAIISAVSVCGNVFFFTCGVLPPGADGGKFVVSNGYEKWTDMRDAAASYFIVVGEALPPTLVRSPLTNSTP